VTKIEFLALKEYSATHKTFGGLIVKNGVVMKTEAIHPLFSEPTWPYQFIKRVYPILLKDSLKDSTPINIGHTVTLSLV